MQIVSNGDNLHQMSKPVFWEIEEKCFKMLSAEILPSVLSVMDLKIILQKHFLFLREHMLWVLIKSASVKRNKHVVEENMLWYLRGASSKYL